MKLIWMGHSSFRMEIGGLTLLIDPWLTGNPVLPTDRHDEAVAGLLNVIDQLGPDNSGSFWHSNGEILPWYMRSSLTKAVLLWYSE